jgi:hypothetical protein|tara:strand:+ start:442 stop:738 length:297 start_codon:yes stop_codon:yes gene_type:complete
MNDNILNDNQYLIEMNEMKEMYEKKEKEINKYKKENYRLKKDLMSCYGMIRILDSQFNNGSFGGDELKSVIEFLRAYLSTVFDDIIGNENPTLFSLYV